MDQKTITTYNELAQAYDDETVDFWANFSPLFIEQFALASPAKVLNIGSGPGRDGLLLQEKGLAVVCLDASEAMIKLSREKGLTSVLGDFMNLPFPDGSFDGVWAYTSLLHIPKGEMGKALREICRVLKIGGVLGLGLIEGETEGYRESSGVKQPRYFSFYTRPEIEQLLAATGFTVSFFETMKPGSKNYLHFLAQKINNE